MCLKAKDFSTGGLIRTKQTTKDVVCYKVVRYCAPGAADYPMYWTPFEDVVIPMDVIKGETPFEPAYKGLGEGRTFGFFGAGAIHSVKDLDHAILIRNWCADHCCPGFMEIKVFQCHIPEGSYYVEGVDDWGGEGYASDALVFDSEVN